MLAASPVLLSDRIVGSIAVLRDESRLRQLVEGRRQFVANVSHELKTPVGALALLAEAVSDVEDPDGRQRLIARLADEAHRLGRVIDDLLELSEVDEADPPRSEVVLSDLVRTACDRLAPLAEEYGVEVEETLTGDVDILGDRRQLDSAISNLVENAIKYSDGHSPVTVTVSEADDWVDVVVTDLGIGISRTEHDRIFERFHRTDRARSRSTGGTGLGLSIVRNVARNHGGDVSVRSREGEGSTFTLRLPLAAAAADLRSVE
jgi:two-component system sensor histidine kinase SenX3